MNRSLLLVLLFTPCILLSQHSLRVMSFNIRYNNPGDGENAWPHRMDLVDRLLQYHRPDIIGVQEALPGQMDDLAGILPGYDFEGIARTEGGEYSAIWYRTSRMERLKGNTFYLSPTPHRLSTGWDAALPRIATWAIFRDRRSDEQLFCINTHFDHVGVEARRNAASLILRMVDSLNTDNLPVVLMGDFNATPDSDPIQTLLAGGMLDSRTISTHKAHGPDGTWSGWTIAGEPGRRIDFVFVKGDMAVYSQASLAESFAGRFPSDHLPVIAEVDPFPPVATPGLHAHNDYEHERPLYDALEAGATSIEADVWWIGDRLIVTHDRPLRPEQVPTLEELYLQPLATWTDTHGGSIYPGYQEPLQLMMDVKSEASATLAALKQACLPYRGLPVRFVISGNRDIEGILADPDSLFFIDGRTGSLEKAETMARVPMVSMHYRAFSSWNGRGEMPQGDWESIRAWANRIHAAGVTARLWAVPEQESVWEALKGAGVDWINTDNLEKGQIFLSDIPGN